MKQTSTLFIKLFLLVALLTGAKAYAGNVPAGSFDVCKIHNTFYLHVSGWAKDDDAPSTSIDVRVDICTDNGYTEVYKSVTLPADKYRQDVGQHAFDEYIEIDAPNTYWVRVTALDATGDNDRVLPIPAASVSNGNNAQPIAMTGWTEINSSNTPTTWGAENTTSYYKVTGDATYIRNISANTGWVTVLGDVTLFLNEGTTLTAEWGITVSGGNKLTIDGPGSLIAIGDYEIPGIGADGNIDPSCGEIVINNGHITATGGNGGAGIGGGSYLCYDNTPSRITINGGVVHATGGKGAPAIGGGMAENNYLYLLDDHEGPGLGDTLIETDGMPGTIVINGGQVTAIADPTVYAIGRGPYATGSIGSVTLGWTNPTDFIYATRLDTALLSIAAGKTFVIGETGNEVNASNVSVLANFSNGTLWPNAKTLGAVTVSGVPDVLTFRDEAIPLNYNVTDASGNTLTEGTDYIAALTFGDAPATELNAVGSYMLTLTAMGEYVGIREFHIEVVDFSVPTDLRQTGYADSSATLEWNVNGGSSGLTLQYSTDDTFAANVTQLEVSGSSTTIEGLDNNLSYYARIKAHNGNKTTDWSDTIRFEASDKTWFGRNIEIEFHSEMLPVEDELTAFSQQIYTPAEIGHAGAINSISFHRGGNSNSSNELYTTLDIYIVYTDKTYFEQFYWKRYTVNNEVHPRWGMMLTDDGVSYSEADKVFSGEVHFLPNSWNTITFDTPFNYDGMRNIVIIIEKNEDSGRYSPKSFDRYIVCDNIQSIAEFTERTMYPWPYTTGEPVVNASKIKQTYGSGQIAMAPYACHLWYDYDSSDSIMNYYSPIKSSIRFGFKEIDLADQTDNTGIISDNNGKYSLVTLSNRTIYSDDDWNTLCLPFNMGDTNAEAGHHFDGTELEGAIVKQLDPTNSSLSNDGTLTLNFTDATNIEAGKPYIVKWNPESFHTDAQGRRIINTADDWNAFASNPNADAILAADITVTTMVGVFYGTFDGNGHTITFNCGSAESPFTDMYCGLFNNINGATIKNLHVEGNIYSNNHYAGGLAGRVFGQCTITNCRVSTNITGVWRSGKFTHNNGGIIGLVWLDSDVNITDCLFDGQLNGTDPGIAGCKGFVGSLYFNTSTATVTRSLFGPNNHPTVMTDYAATFATEGSIYGNIGTVTITDCYYTQALGLLQGTDASSMSAADLAAALGSAWTVSGDKVVPILTTTNNINLNNPSFGPYQIVGAAPTAVTFDEGRCSFQGTYEPFNDRTGLLLDKRNTTGNGVFQAGIDLKGYVVNGWFTDAARTVPATYIPFDENTGQVTLYLNTTEAVKRTVNAATNWDDPTLPIDGWTFVSSPVTGSIAPSDVMNLFPLVENVPSSVSSNYDLYRLNTAETMWENYKTHTNGFTLDNGLGYLYASKDKTTLVFTAGNSSFNTDNSKTVSGLPKGFNLVGNPFKVNAYINKPYYILDETGTNVVPTVVEASTPIAPCTGVVVEVTDDDLTNSTNSVTFSTPSGEHSTGPNNGHLNLILAEQATTRGGASTHSIDQAIVSFNEGARLGKFHFGEQNANIYIPQGGEEYAIACAGRDGACTVSTMPVNFKAVSDGTYTLTVNPENTEMAYLHLIDNITGTDVDLLAQPSYSFEGHVSDYASRFKLVFSARKSIEEIGDDEDFAFISNGEIIIESDGIVQVIDMMGRIIVQRRDGACTVSTDAMAPGMYVLRLTDGENVRTQKIVIP